MHTRDTQAHVHTNTHTHNRKLKHVTINVTVKVLLTGQNVRKIAQNTGMSKPFVDKTSKAEKTKIKVIHSVLDSTTKLYSAK